MSFFKNPEYNSFISVLVIAVVLGVGYVVFQNAGDPDNIQTGRIIGGTKYKNDTTPDQTNMRRVINWSSGGCTVVYNDGSFVGGISQYNANGAFSGCLLPSGEIIYVNNGTVSQVIDDPKIVGIREDQMLLVSQGYLSEADITGEMNTNTVNAIKAFQKKNGLTVTGTITPEFQTKIVGDSKVYSL